MISYLKIGLLMAALTGLLVAIGGYFGGTTWAIGAFVLAAVMNVGAFWFSDRAVLAMYGARKVGPEEAPELYAMVDELRRKAGMPMPVVAIAPQAQPNAFATGRSPKHAVVCATAGLLRMMNKAELRAILGHELAHVKNRDMLVSTVAATLAGAVVLLARMAFFMGHGRDRGPLGAVGALLLVVLAPLAAMLIQLAVTRTGEFRADRAGAELTGQPEDLARALRKLERGAEELPMDVSPAAAHLCIVNPLRGDLVSGIAGLFRTHPPTEERVKRLERLAREGSVRAARW
ncbi:MAG: zinc metalloprotease HtpX [Planctomycetota bacterium]|nr:zinc metalloprotease HtpX [Planctomycetota bacterium]